MSLHADIAVGKLLPQCFLRALCAYERAGVENFTKKIVRQNSRVDATGYLQADFHKDQAPLAPCSFRWIREFALPKMTSIKNKVKVCTDHTLTSELVSIKAKLCQLNTVTK